jgi:arsenite methyltransferase
MKVVRNALNIFILIAVGVVSIRCSGPQHFNELAASEDRESADVIPYLELKEGSVVADLGAGGGYFSFKLAKAVGGSGKVFAVDVSGESILYIQEKAKERVIHNVEPILATFEDSKLKPGSVDLVFIRNTYHDIQKRVDYFSRLRHVLKPKGRIVIIDYDPAKLDVFRKLFGHAIEEKTIISEMKQAGYIVQKRYPVLKIHSFNIFIPDLKRFP